MNKKTCCFTGHRPEKLGYDEKYIKEILEEAIREEVKNGNKVFISGMAKGVDIWASEIVLKMKKEIPDIRLICAFPYNGFGIGADEEERVLYKNIMESADECVFVCEHFCKSCFQLRNIYMVDRSNKVIAVYNGSAGGTKNTIMYAKRKNVEVVNLLETYKRVIDER